MATESHAWLGRPTSLILYDSRRRSEESGHDGCLPIATGETGPDVADIGGRDPALVEFHPVHQTVVPLASPGDPVVVRTPRGHASRVGPSALSAPARRGASGFPKVPTPLWAPIEEAP